MGVSIEEFRRVADSVVFGHVEMLHGLVNPYGCRISAEYNIGTFV